MKNGDFTKKKMRCEPTKIGFWGQTNGIEPAENGDRGSPIQIGIDCGYILERLEYDHQTWINFDSTNDGDSSVKCGFEPSI